MGNVRNIKQTVQEREIIKTAPDLVVYIEGLPYLKNSFLTTNANNPVLVNFNDYITSFTASYDVDQAIPTCTFTLNVPAHLRYLFQAPGGNNLIQSMMQVQAFVKGYYFANDGNTLFHRVFKGFTSHVTHTDDGKTLLISVQCSGLLGFFEMMQIEQNPAIQSSSPHDVTVLKSIFGGMGAYSQLAYVFLYPSFTDGFWAAALQTTAIQQDPYYSAIESGYIAKWQTVLEDICREAHIYGLQVKDVQDVLPDLLSIAVKSKQAGLRSWSFLASQEAVYSAVKESDAPSKVFDVTRIRAYHPDYGMGTLELLNGRVVSRLEFLRILTTAINYECFQDIDGQIIIKPPLYNLDVTNLGSQDDSDANAKYSASHQNTDFTNATNPFIVNLSEIINESETEDQAAVRSTRSVLQGTTLPEFPIFGFSSEFRAVAEFIDLPKLAQFGLRQEPPITVPWLADSDPKACFAQAASEMARRNRAFRTYSFTIPLRPEIHLGFPMYIPHRDMYGYTKSVTINYQIGGTATMSIMLDALRKRPMYPQPQTINGAKSTIFVAQPNLVLKWVQGGSTQPTTQGITNSGTPPGNLIGTQITVPIPPTAAAATPTSDQLALISFQQTQLGSYFATSSDTKDASWQVQFDSEHIWSGEDAQDAAGFFRLVDKNFYEDIRETVPYTDEKGYEVLAPFPWGRWVDIKTALQEFTRDGYVVKPLTQTGDFKLVQGVNTFLYAGMGTPAAGGTAASALQTALQDIQTSVGISTNSGGSGPGTTVSSGSSAAPGTLQTITVFELSYATGSSSSVSGANSIITVGQPDSKIDAALVQTTDSAEQQKVQMFLSGTPPPYDPTLAAQVKAIGNQVSGTVQGPIVP